MQKRIGLGLVLAVGCVNSSATSQQPQNVAKQDDGTGQGHEQGGRNLASTQIQLASGGTFELGVKVLDPDPIYLEYATIKGETTDGNPSKIEIRATVSGTSAGTTIGTGIAAVAGVLTNSVTPGYASDVGPQENVTIAFG